MPARKRIKNLYELVMDFLKKCSDDHVGAFGAMSAFNNFSFPSSKM